MRERLFSMYLIKIKKKTIRISDIITYKNWLKAIIIVDAVAAVTLLGCNMNGMKPVQFKLIPLYIEVPNNGHWISSFLSTNILFAWSEKVVSSKLFERNKSKK